MKRDFRIVPRHVHSSVDDKIKIGIMYLRNVKKYFVTFKKKNKNKKTFILL